MEMEVPGEDEFDCPFIGLIWTTDVVPPPVRKLLMEITLGRMSIATIIAKKAAMTMAAKILPHFLPPLPGSGIGS